MINSVLTPALEGTIVDTIKRQCSLFREEKRRKEVLYYEPYTQRRKQYELTAAVLSGFAPDRFNFPDLQVQDLAYGKNDVLCQPELATSTAIIQIYSSSATPYKNKIVQERCKEYNGSNKNTTKKFLIVTFEADKNAHLKKFCVIYRNGSNQTEETKTLYTAPFFALASA